MEGSGEGSYAKSSAVRHPDRQVRKDGAEAVRERGFEGEVVRDFVDGEKQVLVRSRADDVGCCQKRPG